MNRVEQLRLAVKYYPEHAAMLNAAADEIESMESQLAQNKLSVMAFAKFCQHKAEERCFTGSVQPSMRLHMHLLADEFFKLQESNHAN